MANILTRLEQIGHILVDILIFTLVCAAELITHFKITPLQRGFFCGDESLAYPFRPGFIDLIALCAIVLTVPTMLILVVELFKFFPFSLSSGKSMSTQVQHLLVTCCKQFGFYLFGLALTLLATDVGKIAAGRLRPHFFAVCQPQLADGSSCADAKNHGIYIEDYICRGGENVTEYMLHNLGQSFPSGYASMLFYSMLYAAIYLQATLSTRSFKFPRYLLQFVFVAFAWVMALRRIGDNWNHWSDILCGAVLGSIFAVIVAVFVADLFERKRYSISGGYDNAANENRFASVPNEPPTPVLPLYIASQCLWTAGSRRY